MIVSLLWIVCCRPCLRFFFHSSLVVVDSCCCGFIGMNYYGDEVIEFKNIRMKMALKFLNSKVTKNCYVYKTLTQSTERRRSFVCTMICLCVSVLLSCCFFTQSYKSHKHTRTNIRICIDIH